MTTARAGRFARPTFLAWALIAAAAAPAAAHVAPSLRDNNRYLTVAPLGDRIRLAYTVFLGQIPGHELRRRMDKNGDGVVSDDEAQAWGDDLAAQVAGRLEMVVDGRRQPVVWNEVDVSLNGPSTGGGAFAVDLVAWTCFDHPHARFDHHLVLFDRFRVPTPGESELMLQDSPGVRIVRSQFGAEDDPSKPPRLDFRWRGGAGPAATDGYRLDMVVDPATATFVGGPCPGPRPRRGHARSGHRLWWLGGLIAAGLLVVALAAARRARRRSPVRR